MDLNPRSLRPVELGRLLNSTPLGTVVSDRLIRDHRTAAGFRIGEGQHVDLVRYVAWLRERRKTRFINESSPPPAIPAEAAYAAHKERARARNAAMSRSGRDIGEPHEVVDPARKAACLVSLKLYCETYHPETFCFGWSPDHLRIIERIEGAILRGKLFAMAMPRGSGKTSLVEAACLWAILIGAHKFIVLIGSDADAAKQLLDSIKIELETNDRLFEDFPLELHPIRCLEGIAQKCNGQLFRGQRTHIGWKDAELVMPTVAGSPASGTIIKVRGLTGRIRGLKHKRADGGSVRPSLVILDDPQTDDSARSVLQTRTRESTIAGAVLGLAGPGCKISGIMPCTVIRKGDLADALLDRAKHPQWQGERTKLVYEWPKTQSLWDEYSEIRSTSLRHGGDGAEATEFYRDNRAAMDEGAIVAWEERKKPDELSAIQSAMNLRFDLRMEGREHAFFAEYQNEPLDEEELAADMPSADEIDAKRNHLRRGIVPMGASILTGMIDVHKALLYYGLAGFEEGFSGDLIHYGTWPKQAQTYFGMSEVRRTIMVAYPNLSFEAALKAALTALVEKMVARAWQREDGAAMHVERILIDANWGDSTEIIYDFCRTSPYASILTPSHGRGVRASDLPFSSYRKQKGDRIGFYWRQPSVKGRRATRYVLFDTNFWKSFLMKRLATPAGEPGCLQLFGLEAAGERVRADHRLICDHLVAEYPVPTEARERRVDEWKARPGQPDNHLLDMLVGCHVGASMQGIALAGEKSGGKKKRTRYSLLERRNRRQ